MLTLAAVYKDILPGYKIRLPTDKEQGVSLSKEVRKLREHEALLLSTYQVCFASGILACNTSWPQSRMCHQLKMHAIDRCTGVVAVWCGGLQLRSGLYAW